MVSAGGGANLPSLATTTAATASREPPKPKSPLRKRKFSGSENDEDPQRKRSRSTSPSTNDSVPSLVMDTHSPSYSPPPESVNSSALSEVDDEMMGQIDRKIGQMEARQKQRLMLTHQDRIIASTEMDFDGGAEGVKSSASNFESSIDAEWRERCIRYNGMNDGEDFHLRTPTPPKFITSREEEDAEYAEIVAEWNKACALKATQSEEERGQRHVTRFRRDENGTVYIWSGEMNRGRKMYKKADSKTHGTRWLGDGKGSVPIHFSEEFEIFGEHVRRPKKQNVKGIKESEWRRMSNDFVLYDGRSQSDGQSSGQSSSKSSHNSGSSSISKWW